MKNVKEIISQIPKYTAYSFSMSMVVYIVIGLIAGVESMSLSILIQLLIVCFIAAILQMIAFSDICMYRPFISFVKTSLYKKINNIYVPIFSSHYSICSKMWLVSSRKHRSMDFVYRNIYYLFCSKYNII